MMLEMDLCDCTVQCVLNSPNYCLFSRKPTAPLLTKIDLRPPDFCLCILSRLHFWLYHTPTWLLWIIKSTLIKSSHPWNFRYSAKLCNFCRIWLVFSVTYDFALERYLAEKYSASKNWIKKLFKGVVVGSITPFLVNLHLDVILVRRQDWIA